MTVNYHEVIVGNGLPIVFFHGFQLDHQMMYDAFEPLLMGHHFKRIYLDLPGCGKTSDYESIVSADLLGQSLVSHLKSLVGDEDFLIVGMSYGGYISRLVAHDLKEQVKGILLFAPVVDPDFANRKLPQHEILIEDKNFTAGLEPQILEELRNSNVIITQYVHHRQEREMMGALKMADETYLENYQKTGYKASFDVDAFNQSFKVPVSIIAGKQDAMVGYEDQFVLSQTYPYCNYLAINGAGHSLHIEQTEIFNAEVKQWLKMVEVCLNRCNL